ncbi:MFS transporter [SAR202 cluster bacterium AC-409-J13_OGT_754m]|nr:MFS transporter [SAR202 cluster bacterium AC-409-J13_OGT_754m]
MRPLTRMVDLFRISDYRMLWGHNVFASLGMSMETLAQGWLTLMLTDSVFWVGLVMGVRGIGQIIVAPIAGVIADRFDRRRELKILQILRALVCLMVGILIVSELLEPWHLLPTAFIAGVLFAMTLPANGTLVYDIVGRDKLLNAIAVHFAALSVARLPGSILVGILLAFVGEGAAYFAISAAFALSLVPLSRVKEIPQKSGEAQPVLMNVMAGLRYAAGHKTIRRMLAFTILIESFGFAHQAMLPVIARNYLDVGATGLGFLGAAGSVGSLLGIMFLGLAHNVRRKGLILLAFGAAVGCNLMLFGASSWYGASLILAAAIQWSLVTYDATLNTTLLLMVTDKMRGRIVGLVSFAYGFTPIGGFIYGAMATFVGAPSALAIGGGAILIGWLGLMAPLRELRGPLEGAAAEIDKRDGSSLER